MSQEDGVVVQPGCGLLPARWLAGSGSSAVLLGYVLPKARCWAHRPYGKHPIPTARLLERPVGVLNLLLLLWLVAHGCKCDTIRYLVWVVSAVGRGWLTFPAHHRSPELLLYGMPLPVYVCTGARRCAGLVLQMCTLESYSTWHVAEFDGPLETRSREPWSRLGLVHYCQRYCQRLWLVVCELKRM